MNSKDTTIAGPRLTRLKAAGPFDTSWLRAKPFHASWLRRARDGTKQFNAPLIGVTALLALYLAVASTLRAAKVPNEQVWAPGNALFILVVVCAVWVPLYALYKSIDAYFQEQDINANKIDKTKEALTRDLNAACQQIVAAIADSCRGLNANALATQIRMCLDDGTFQTCAHFHLPLNRPNSGITWQKGKGVAGLAWETRSMLVSDLRPLYARLDDLGPDDFDDLPPDERFGMDAREVKIIRDTTGVYALPLFERSQDGFSHEPNPGPDPELLAIFTIDSIGYQRYWERIVRAAHTREVSTTLAGCETRLTEAKRILSSSRGHDDRGGSHE